DGLTPLHVAAARGCRRCLQQLLRTRGCSELPEKQVGGHRGGAPNGVAVIPHSLDALTSPSLSLEPGWDARHPQSFLTEDGTDGSLGTPEGAAGPLSSTRRSLLELEDDRSLVDPPPWQGCSSFLSIPSSTPWPPGGSAAPPQPLASSTLLWAGDELGEGRPSRIDSSGDSELFVSAVETLEASEAGGPTQDSPADAQGFPSVSCSPTVLLVPGGPQDSAAEAEGSPSASYSPTVLLVPGDPQDSPLNTQGSPAATPSCKRWVVPPSPLSCSTHRCGEGAQASSGQRSPGTEATSSPKNKHPCPVPPWHLSDEVLRQRLQALGDNPGPITAQTRHSPELVAALGTGRIPDCAREELELAQQFDRPDRLRCWREGSAKSSFNYLLLDPRITQNLPLRSQRLSLTESFSTFVDAIFYVGKGTGTRPWCHLTEALSQHRAGTRRGSAKVRHILDIWCSGHGVLSLHCFQNAMPAEAYTRESCLVEALGLPTITNQRKGICYGVAAKWPVERRRRFGVHLLHRALSIFLAEGERQLHPGDLHGGR
ncbi:ANKL1 protein, partial [Rhinopomastus cyanomelas]|nr:ANKL1 protein [Rhinopomastus cyanomelas]